MAIKYQGFPGMDDLLPGEIEKWQWIEEKARIFFESRGFKEIRTPLLESTELFARSIGEASDIVHKEMYSFEDRGGRGMTLRPEMTASVARAVVEHGLLKTAKSLRLFYWGPMFRAERPQAGRKRQFHQFGVEIINESGYESDFEAISSLYHFLVYLGVKKPKIRINDLGVMEHEDDVKRSGKFTETLREYFEGHRSGLCQDCHYRLERNVLRIFDCKNPGCQAVIDKAPWDEIAPLSGDFQALTEKLCAARIPFEKYRRLVRGLDYYNGAVFEVSAEGLGAQDAIAGGGRYDSLYGELGAPGVPCTGFSIGIERLIAALEYADRSFSKKVRERFVYLAALEWNDGIAAYCYDQALMLGQRGIRVALQPGVTDLKTHLKRANQMGIRYLLILGPDEMQKGMWTVKDLETRKQTEVEMGRGTTYLAEVMGL